MEEHVPSVLIHPASTCSLGVCDVCGRIGQVRDDWVTEAGSLLLVSFTVSLDIIAIHVEGTAYYDVECHGGSGRGRAWSAREVKEGCKGSGS